ncbi:MAG: helix-turn-helix transcriptional regulator [Erysipelotrichaceae bacterium]|nr:helix-turn-helix transcriptional regulator [Erysipelotrichaceae bacterium]
MSVTRIDISKTAENIANLRIEKNLSIKQIQDALGFNNPQAFYKWQRGENLPTLDNLVILADIYGVSLDEIIAVKKEEF